MKPVEIICLEDETLFEQACAELIERGYYVASSSCACNGEFSEKTYQAIMVMPVSVNSEAVKTSHNSALEEKAIYLMRELAAYWPRRDEDKVEMEEDIGYIVEQWNAALQSAQPQENRERAENSPASPVQQTQPAIPAPLIEIIAKLIELYGPEEQHWLYAKLEQVQQAGA
jgi:hypothetical protein